MPSADDHVPRTSDGEPQVTANGQPQVTANGQPQVTSNGQPQVKNDDEPPVQREFPRIEGQAGLATTAQLRQHGWTADTIRHRRDRTIQRVYPGVYASHRGPLDVDTRLLAASLWAGESAVLTGRVALDRHGLSLDSLGTCVFLVPSNRRVRRAQDARTVRTGSPINVARHHHGVPLTDVARALCDAANHQGLAGKQLEAVSLSALQRRLTHPDRLADELLRHRRRDVSPIRAALAAFDQGAWSLPEAALARLLESDPDLPRFVLNPVLWTPSGDRIGCPDAYFPDSGVAAQVHSKAFHSGTDDEGKDRWSATVEKDGQLVAHGVVVVPITPTSIDRRPRGVIDRLRQTVATNAGRDMSHVLFNNQ